ncbi:response regulator [Bacteroides sp. GD17]|jgi:signal transduction histidine kinase|uniref:hybrid sensor histidine kinase/response regulator n=1 Tax=Bacteroides sp. GD17 TaxID=3139826 RepID=UPI0025EA54E9|nr:response regulator [uncultured Bacteroides sp.]
MEQNETVSHDNEVMSSGEKPELVQEELLLAESLYARLPISIEIYDVDGVLRSINDHALLMYGVEDRTKVVNTVNLFNSPYMDDELKKKIRVGDDVSLEFEFDFDRINDDAYFVSNNQKSIIYEAKIVPLRNDAGTIIGHILLSNDVTAAKEADFRTEESKKNLEMAMDAAKMSSWVYDVHKKTFSPLYGEPIIKTTVGWENMLSRLHPQDRMPLQQIFSQLVDRKIQHGHITLRCYDEEKKQYRFYESRMRLSSEHRGKLLIIGTQLEVTEKVLMTKKTEELIAKRELAMQVSNIVHWDFDVRTQKMESYNDPINDYASDKQITIPELREVTHPEDYSVFNDAIQSMISGKNMTLDLTCRIKTKYDDAWQYCNVIGVPFEQDENGNIMRYTGFRQNISKLHQLDEELKERNYKMELTFKTVGMSYWDFDVRSRLFKAFNDPVNDYDPERPIAPEDYQNFAHPDDVERFLETMNLMLQGTDTDFTLKYRSKTKWDQEWQSLVVTGIQSEKNKAGKVIRYTGICFNNTEWEKVTQELKELKEKAELSDKLKSAFLANMSHEIRTPLNAIVGFSELMAYCEDPAEKEEYVEIIHSNNELLLRLIDDILDLSKIESGILERKRETFNLAKLRSELYTMILPKVTNPDVEFLLDSSGAECNIFLDRNRLKQVWLNFLSNAVKCTHSGHIKMGYSIERGGIRIYVEDTGVGIPLDLQDRVFGRFQKLNEFAQGTGLGLAISRAIIEGAGGEIGFVSTPDVGTTFWAWTPCEITYLEEEEDNILQPVEQKLHLKRANKQDLRILIAEDNDSNYSLVQHILKDYNTTRAVNGADAVQKVREEHFDFVLMDMKMPIMGGLEAVRRIREFNQDILIIALTANAFESDRIAALEAGCNVFIAKPLKQQELFSLFSTEE